MNRTPSPASWLCRAATLAAVTTSLVLAACATRVVDDATELARAGRHDEALALLAEERARSPRDEFVRAADVRLREAAIGHFVVQAESARAGGRLEEALNWLARARAVDPLQPRVVALATGLERAQRREQALRAAQAAEEAGRTSDAEARVARLLAEWPGDPQARELQRRLRERRPNAQDVPVLAAALSVRLNLEFRDAPLRSVLEGLSRSHGVNFVFDKDVRADARVNVLLRDTPLSDGLRIILTTQQLASKTLNERTLFIYSDTAAKRAEHRELVTRSFYLANADVKQAQAMVKTMAKTRDVFIDERLNHLMVRDTPEAVRLVERLLAAIDVAEPEVVLEVEVLEITSSQLNELGIQWPDQVSFGIPGVSGAIELAQRGSFRSSVANPALLGSLRETISRSNTLANPRLRARNREKAKVTVGEKLPVFTTTTTVNGSSAAVTYLDVGLKLEVEPSVQLEGDVVMKVALEVSTLIGKVSGPQGAVGYQVGTREASTTLRLRDGETQILAGLIRDEDSKSVAGLPGAAQLPLLGRLFGLHTDGRNKTEVVLLITPRVVRSIVPPDVALGNAPGGSDVNPGEAPLRLAGIVAVALPSRAGRAESMPSNTPTAAPATETAAARIALVQIAATANSAVGSIVSVTLANGSDTTLEGELQFDPNQLQAARAGAALGPRLTFRLDPGSEQVVPFRVLAGAAGQRINVAAAGLSAVDSRGESVAVQVQGEATINIAAAK